MYDSDSDSEMPLIKLETNEVDTHDMQDITLKVEEIKSHVVYADSSHTLKSITHIVEHACNLLPIVYTKRLDEMEAFQLENLSPGRIIQCALDESKPKFQSVIHGINNTSKDHWLQSYRNFKSNLDIIFKRKEKHCNRSSKKENKPTNTKEILHQIKPVSVVVTDFKRYPSKHFRIINDSSVMINNNNSEEKVIEKPKTFVFRDTNKHMVHIFTLNSKNELLETYTLLDDMFTTMLHESLETRSIDLVERNCCCWVKIEQRVKEMGDQYINMLKQVQRTHSCPPNNCNCCSPSNTCESNRENILVSQLKNSNDMCNIYIKNDITKQLEFYEISKKANANFQYITCPLNDRVTVAKIKKKLNNNAENKIVIKRKICCWFNQKKVLNELRSQIPQSIANFMKSRHECSLGFCECCCYETEQKSRRLKSFDSCISMNLSHSKNFTLSEKIHEQVYCAMSKTPKFNNKPLVYMKSQTKKIQPQLSSIMKHNLKITLHDHPNLDMNVNLFELVLKFTDKFLNKPAVSFENDILILQDCIMNILNILEDIILTVELNGKISAILKTPITNLPTSSLKVLAVVISCAQIQIEENKMISKLLSKNGLKMPDLPENSQPSVSKPIPYSFLYNNLPSCNLNKVNLRSFSHRISKKKTMFNKSYSVYESNISNRDNLSHEVKSELPIIEKTFSLKDLDEDIPVIKVMTHNSKSNQSKEQNKTILHNLLSKPPNINQLNTLYTESQKRKLSSNLNETTKESQKELHEKPKRKKKITKSVQTMKTQKIKNSKSLSTVPFFSALKATSSTSSTPEFIYDQNAALTKKPDNLAHSTDEVYKNSAPKVQNVALETFLPSKILIAHNNFLEDCNIKEEYCILDDNEETNI